MLGMPRLLLAVAVGVATPVMVILVARVACSCPSASEGIRAGPCATVGAASMAAKSIACGAGEATATAASAAPARSC